MSKRKLYTYLAAASGYTGIGLLLGYLLGDRSNDNPMWFGGALLVIGAVLLGMAISAASENKQTDTSAKIPAFDEPTDKKQF